MTSRKRNEWLDSNGTEDEDEFSDDERFEESRGATIAGRSSKRRKLDGEYHSASEHDSLEDGNNGEEDQELDYHAEEEIALRKQPDVASKQPTQPPSEHASAIGSRKEPSSSLAKQLAKATEKAHKSGVVYISRIPPFMKPHTVKKFLLPYAKSGLGRIFLTPETEEARTSRVRAGGNRKRNFTDGWVEFMSKGEAKVAVETLNTRIIGGKKGRYYHDDVWNLKYLKGFKWRHLTEQMANENAERAARMRAEDARERREARDYLLNVETAKMLEGMEKKREKKALRVDEESSEIPQRRMKDEESTKTVKRQFRQVQVKSKSANGEADNDPPDDVKRVLSKIF